ncbi:MAG: SMI1/KNR4 family protein [Lachnospiraceae bacterium]|nr:SMI1/KNR4 family protein [Lachnospiraceae bacterium]
MLISKYGNGSVELVEEFENKYGIKFDEEYRIFLIKYNGGDTPLTSIKRGKHKEDVRYLYGINTNGNIEKEFKYFDWAKLQCIPIGEDCFGNYFTIGITEENKGVIYFCDHERGFRKAKIADSFKKFVEKCNSDIMDESFRRTPEETEKFVIANGYGDKINDALRKVWKEEYEYYKDMVQEEVIL